MYEIVPVGVESSALIGDVDDLKYQDNSLTAAADDSGELMTVKLRYKAPDGDTSKLIERPVAVPTGDAVIGGNNFYFSAAVAAFGMILRDSKYKGTATLDQVMALARDAQGADSEGYRAEFIRLVGDYQDIVGTGAEPTASR
jgi:Ca-activated chloride channel family protein